MKKLLQKGIFYALLCLAPLGINAQVKLAEWNFDHSYTQTTSTDTTVYTPTSTLLAADPNITMYNSKFRIYPDSAKTSILNYRYNAVTTYCQLKSGYNNYVSRLYFAGPSTVSDYSNSANHNNYFQFSLPTTGYDSIKVNFSIAGGQNSTADYMELVYSVDGGTTWTDAGSYHTLSGWWLYQNYQATIAARNKANVLVRLVANTTSTSGSVTFMIDKFYVTGKPYSSQKLLYNTNFQNWTNFSASAVGATNTVTKTTDFSKESLTFTFSEISCDIAGTNAKFVAPATLGYLMCAKTSTTYFTTSALASMTKIFIIEAATGSNRGFKIFKKGTTDADWVSIYSTAANPAGGDSTTIAIPGDQTNVQLKFTNLSADLTPASLQNAYLTDFQIYGNYESTAAQQLLTTSMNIVGAGIITKSPNATTYDQNSTVTLTATKNFGYKFVNWIDSVTNTVLSTSNSYVVTMDANKHIQAIFAPVNTYSLAVGTKVAPSYMLSVTPAGTTVGGKTMYEEGVVVTLTASSNQIMTFTNWDTGETSATKVLTMTENKVDTAYFSASDYIVGWDFYKTGASGRPADFYSTLDNQASTFIARNAAGTSSSWLDKSIVAAAGYYNRGAAVNWKNLTDQYYYQISFSAKDFTGVKVSAGMLYNYNAYQIQKFEYSFNGTYFTTLGKDTLKAAAVWYDKTFALPDSANHADKVYIRFIPDFTSTVVGAAGNDGTSISNIYVTGTASIYNPGVPPTLTTSVPVANSTTASTTGKVVLTFNTKVQLTSGATATLGSKTLTPAVAGTTVTFPYAGLDYNTQYTFTLPGNTVSDLAGNTVASPISITFTTMNRPTVTKKSFDFVVGVDGDFKAALAAATAASSTGNRFYIFLPKGQYNIGANTGDANQMTTISTPNLSIIGQSGDSVVVYNKSTQESINSTATMYFTSASSNNYLQDITLMNKMDYRITPLVGRGVALWDQGNKSIYKGVKLCSNQDTYFTGSSIRSYLENCEIHGTVDYICGGGDIFFNECLLYMENRTGNVISAPSTNTTWGYVFNNCTIDGFAINSGSYCLGRPWQNSPKAVYLNTKMNIIPSAAGWTDMGTLPGLFAEYNSTTATGTAVDVSARKTSFSYGTPTVTTAVTYNPVLTAAQAATYTVDNVLGGTDTWQPRLYTDQAIVPAISGSGTSISWADNNYVLCWAVFKNDVFVKFVTTNSYTIPSSVTSGTYTVRAANEMGGLSAVSNVYAYSSTTTGINNPDKSSKLIEQTYYAFDGRKIRRLEGYKGTVIVRSVYADGRVEVSKILKMFY